jgi:hypothetical protein
MHESRIQENGHIFFTNRAEIFINTFFRFQSLVTTAHPRHVLVFRYGQYFKYTAARSLINRLDRIVGIIQRDSKRWTQFRTYLFPEL